MSTMQIVYLAWAAGLILAWLMLAVFGPRRPESANILADLRYGVALRSFALALALIVPLIMFYVVWTFPWGRNETRLNLAGVSFAATSILAGLLLIEVTRTQIVLREDGVTRFSPWRGPASLSWIDTERVRYSAVNRWFLMEGAGRTIRVSRHLAGIGIFAQTIKRKLPTERWSLARSALDAV